MNEEIFNEHNREVERSITRIDYQIAMLEKERNDLEKLLWRKDSDTGEWTKN